MQRAIALSQRIDFADHGPKISLYMLVTPRKQVDIIENSVAPVVLNVYQARTLRLDSHVDVLGHQADKLSGVFRLEAQGHIDYAIVIGLILRTVKIRHITVANQSLVRVYRECSPGYVLWR